MHTGFCWGNVRKGRPRRRWEDDNKMDLQKWNGEAWARLMWLRIGSSGGPL